MKIAIINQYSSAGGGARFIRALGKALAQSYPEMEIGFFTDADNLSRDSFSTLFQDNKNVKVYPLSRKEGKGSVVGEKKNIIFGFYRCLKDRLKKSRIVVKAYNFIRFRVLKIEDPWYKLKLSPMTINEIEEYDVIYLSWPYFIEPHNFKKPVVGTFHDFNYKHFLDNFTESQLRIIERQMPLWLSIVKKAVVSTNFIGKELKTFYPESADKTETVYLTSFSITRDRKNIIKDIRKKFNLPDKYILSPSNTSPHKNLKGLLTAVGILKQNNFPIKLVLTGFGTENLALLKKGVKVTEYSFPQKVFVEYQAIIDKYDIKPGEDIFPLGYVSDGAVDAIIENAQLVVSTSIYEAGSGPAVDAWSLSTPVAFSSIEPFMEQLEFLGTKAWVFDPNDPKDIAKVLKEALQNDKKREEMARISKEAIDRYTWDDVAKGYYKVFEEAVKE